MKAKHIELKKLELEAENRALQSEIEKLKAILIEKESRRGVRQIPVPGASKSVQSTSVKTTQKVVTPAQTENVKPPNEKKPKKEKPAQAVAPTAGDKATAEAPVDIGRLDLRIGKIVDVQRHPDADSLYLEKIDCGEPQPRIVVSGLVKFVPIEEMQNRIVVVLCNLKPAKMRGVTSEAMVMCASTPEKVEVLTPPPSSAPGDLVHCEGYNRNPDAQMNPKKKIFETVAPDLRTNDQLVACYKNAALHVPGKGNIQASTLKNVQVK